MSNNHFIVRQKAGTKKSRRSSRFIPERKTFNIIGGAKPSLVCYLDISINEMTYHFNSLSDQILYSENENAIIYFENEASTKFGWINFKSPLPEKADTIEFFEPGSDTFLLLFKKFNSTYPVTFTEYSPASAFICGHYSGIYTDAKDNPVYNVSCSFCVRRPEKK